ncbi:MAG: hypothetical protein FWH03_08135 [Firmicutes bacterium]|nr:hypothetical protein [Bacillota bacterium]
MNDEKTAAAEKAVKPEKKGIFARLKKIKHIEIIVAFLAVAVMLVIYFGARGGGGGENSADGAHAAVQQQRMQEDYCAKMERQLTETLSRMQGAGETRVIINWETGVESVIAYITNSGNNSITSTPQVITGGGAQGPIVLKEIYPKALGVVIMTQGGADARIRLEMINAVSILLQITPAQIQVLTMQS